MKDWNEDEAKPPTAGAPTGAPEAFRDALIAWFEAEGRDYPWRRTRDPYAILVSELMLQQTQIATVLGRGYFENWMAVFPDVATLATAEEDAVLKAWEGLGYYRRARNLQKAARAVVERHGGRFPRDHEAIRALPGVGDYTAGAVAAFAFDEAAAMVDANVARVLTRLFDETGPVESTAVKRRLAGWSRALVDPGRARLFQSALMELGQRLCTPRRPACGVCPVNRFCLTRDAEALPVKRRAPRPEEVDEAVLWMREGGRSFLVREEGSRRAGFWRLPEIPGEGAESGDALLRFTYGITRYRVRLRVYRGAADRTADWPAGIWVTDEGLEELALAAPYRKAVEQLLAREREGDWLLP